MINFEYTADAIRELALKGIPADVAPALLEYVDRLNLNDAKRQKAEGRERYATFALDPAATGAGKYIQIVMTTGGQRSVHAVVIKATGEVCKSAGWKGGPVKSTAKATRGKPLVKYTLTDEASRTALFDRLDTDASAFAGGYLYQGR